MPRKSAAIDLKSIYPQGGDRRAAFEELSFLLFAREYRSQGVPLRREGAGGDKGLEGIIADTDGRALIGAQSKFFADKLGPTQWRDLDESIRTALADNARDGTLREIVVTLPRNLTKEQAAKWNALRNEWREEARRLGYSHAVSFTLWHETHLRGLLLTPANRGLLLHYFEFPDLDIAHCRGRTRLTIAGLGDRYQPQLHTTTSAESRLHTFLRSEHSRQEYLEAAREQLHDRWWLREPRADWPKELHADYARAETAWQAVLTLLGDGVSLPASFAALAESCSAAAAALNSIEDGIFKLIPPRERKPEDDYGYPQSRHPNEEMLNGVDRWGHSLRSFASYLRSNQLADVACLRFSGGPGTGKTHVLAEVCSRNLAEGSIALLVEGAAFTSNEPVALQFMRWLGRLDLSFRDFLEALAVMAEATKTPALICLEAVNETPDQA